VEKPVPAHLPGGGTSVMQAEWQALWHIRTTETILEQAKLLCGDWAESESV
jgi:hypothetical protein